MNYETPWVTGLAAGSTRWDLASAVVGDKLYSSGGYSGSSHLSSMEHYDPSTNSWTSRASLSAANHLHSLTESGGYLYAIGGLSGGSTVYSTVERYNPATNSWSAMTSLPVARYHHAAAAVGGKIYVFGGYTSTSPTTTTVVYCYDIAGNSWSTKASLPTARAALSASVINGKIHVIGGNVAGSNHKTLNEIYDPATDSWTTGAPMPSARSHHLAVVDDTRLYILGGEGTSSKLNTVLQYDAVVNSWVSVTSFSQARYKFACGIINGKIYLSQGNSGSGGLSSTESVTLPKTGYQFQRD